MTAAQRIIAAAKRRDAAANEARVKAVRKLVEKAQDKFDKRAARATMTSKDLDRAYSL